MKNVIIILSLLVLYSISKAQSFNSLVHVKRGNSFPCNLEVDTSKPLRWVLLNTPSAKIISRHVNTNPNKYLKPAAWESLLVDPIANFTGYTVLDFWLLPYSPKTGYEVPKSLSGFKEEKRYVYFE